MLQVYIEMHTLITPFIHVLKHSQQSVIQRAFPLWEAHVQSYWKQLRCWDGGW